MKSIDMSSMDVKNIKLMSNNLIFDKVKVDNNVFHERVEHRVEASVGGTDIITVYYWSRLKGDVKFVQYISDSIEFYNSGGDDSIFNFNGGSCDCIPFFGTSMDLLQGR